LAGHRQRGFAGEACAYAGSRLRSPRMDCSATRLLAATRKRTQPERRGHVTRRAQARGYYAAAPGPRTVSGVAPSTHQPDDCQRMARPWRQANRATKPLAFSLSCVMCARVAWQAKCHACTVTASPAPCTSAGTWSSAGCGTACDCRQSAAMRLGGCGILPRP
jgi:hypothetical protein